MVDISKSVGNVFSRRIEMQMKPQRPRGYLGISELGGQCERKMYYSLKGEAVNPVNQRLRRIFNRGYYEEEVVFSDLTEAGFEVMPGDIPVFTGHPNLQGHADGIVLDECGRRLLLEVKTMNDQRFKTYIKQGLEESNPQYWAQIHLYMLFLELDRCLFVVTNKNTEERDYNIIEFDKAVAERFWQRGLRIAEATEAPEGFGDKTFYLCKMCEYSGKCYS